MEAMDDIFDAVFLGFDFDFTDDLDTICSTAPCETVPIDVFDTPEEAPKKKRKHAAVAKKAKKTSPPPVPPAIPPIPQDDVRRLVPKHIFDAYNTGDPEKLIAALHNLCDADNDYNNVKYIARYDGIRNPHGRNYVEMDGVHAIFDLFKLAMKSSPDGFFEILETRSCYLPSEGSFDARTAVCVVASRYRYDGTRVLNIKVTTTATEGAAESGSPETGEVTVNYWDQSQSATTALQSPRFSLDVKPLADKKLLHFTGTVCVYLVYKGPLDTETIDEKDFKVIKLEWAYTAVD